MGELSPVRLLLVDDETQLLKLMETFLGRIGYQVVSHTSAAAALGRFEADPQDTSRNFRAQNGVVASCDPGATNRNSYVL